MQKYSPNPLRALARSTYYQTLYNRSKDMASIQIFDNSSDFSAIQINFLNWIAFYNALETDLAMNEPNISREVIDNDIRADAYMEWKVKVKNKKDKEPVISNAPLNSPSGKPKREKRQIDTNSNIPSIRFTRERK